MRRSDAALSYVLATGNEAAHRLRLLNRLYGPGTGRLLRQSGVRPGMRIADLGCGVGMVTVLLADLAGPEGEVIGVDSSPAQLEEARARTRPFGARISFVAASAMGTGLPGESFDCVYCRFLLIHLPDPEQALLEMRRLLKPGGILVCEDGDLTSAGSLPPTALDAFADLWGRLGERNGNDYTLGRRLYHLVAEAGFRSPEISFNQPVAARGEAKRLLELSVAEAGPAFVEAGLLTAAELERLLGEMRRAAEDETALAVMPRMAQVWARK